MSAISGIKLDFGGGLSERSFIHINDVDATLKICSYGKVSESYHISTNKLISILDLVKLIASYFGKKIEDLANLVDENWEKIKLIS